MSEWTRGLSKQQMEVIKQDTKEFEKRHPDQKQQHVYIDIENEIREREHNKKR